MRTHKGCSASGLDGVVVAQTDLSEVDGEAGRLVIGGHEVEALTGAVPFEDVCALLWDGALPDAGGREQMRAALAEARVRAAGLLPELGNALALPDGMDALRASMAHLMPKEGAVNASIVGAAAVFAAAWARTQMGVPVVPP